MQSTSETVQSWQDSVNSQNADALLELSDADIEIVGPRGSAFGHGILLDWLARAGLSLATTRTFVRNDTVVLAQHGVWRSSENQAIIGQADVASEFRVKNQKVTKVARYDTLDEALAKAHLNHSDEQQKASTASVSNAAATAASQQAAQPSSL